MNRMKKIHTKEQEREPPFRYDQQLLDLVTLKIHHQMSGEVNQSSAGSTVKKQLTGCRKKLKQNSNSVQQKGTDRPL